MRTRVLKSVLAASVLALGLAGCATDKDKTTTESGAKVIKEGKLTVCTHMPYKPFQYNEGGKVVGFDVDLMDLVAKELDLEQEIFDTPFEGIETGQAMSTGKCDIAAAGMTITDDRAEVMDFSDPYFDATQALLVKKGSGIGSLEDLDGKSLGVQVDTTGQKYADENAPEGAEIRDFEDLALLTQAVKNGQVDAGINDNTVLYDYVDGQPRHRGRRRSSTPASSTASPSRWTETTSCSKTVNDVLAKAKEDGTYDAIYKKYFGEAPSA